MRIFLFWSGRYFDVLQLALVLGVGMLGFSSRRSHPNATSPFTAREGKRRRSAPPLPSPQPEAVVRRGVALLVADIVADEL